MTRLCVLLLSGALIAAAASIDGKRVAKIEGRKATQEIVLDLKADGDRLTGTVASGRRMRAVTIQDGKIEGDQLSFTTVTKGANRKINSFGPLPSPGTN